MRVESDGGVVPAENDFPQVVVRKVIVFSVLYNENLDYLREYLLNFLKFNKNEYLFVNFSESLYEEVVRKSFNQRDFLIGTRVFFVKADRPRFKYGAGLLLAHLYNFQIAQSIFEFDYFCTMASNCLFFRELNIVEVTQHLENSKLEPIVPLHEDKTDGNWANTRKSKEFMRFFEDKGVTHFHCNQIEGFMTSRGNWQIMLQHFDAFAEIGNSFKEEKDAFFLEEIVPGTMVTNFGDKKYIHICWNYWGRITWGGKVDFTDLFADFERSYSPQTYALKWFDRTVSAPLTKVMFNDDMFEMLLSIKQNLQKSDSYDLVVYSQMLDAAAANCRARLGAKNDLFSQVMLGHEGKRISTNINSLGKREILSTFADFDLNQNIYFENLKDVHSQFTLIMSHGSQIKAEVSWTGKADYEISENKRKLVGYWYLPIDASLINKPFDFILQLSQTDPSVAQEDPRLYYGCVVLKVDGSYYAMNCDYFRRADTQELSFHFDADAFKGLASNSKEVFLGLPIICGRSVVYSANIYSPMLDAATRMRLGMNNDLFSQVMPGHEDKRIETTIDSFGERTLLKTFGDFGLSQSLYFEALANARDQFKLVLHHGSQIKAEVSWVSESNYEFSENNRKLVAYWYLPIDVSLVKKSFHITIQLSELKPAVTNDEELRLFYGCMVLQVNGSYFPLECVNLSRADKHELSFYFDPTAFKKMPADSGEIFLGLPIISGRSVSFSANYVVS